MSKAIRERLLSKPVCVSPVLISFPGLSRVLRVITILTVAYVLNLSISLYSLSITKATCLPLYP